MTIVEIRVPPLGDFKDVPVVELFLIKGMSIEPEQSMLTVESDKATMDVPSPLAGTVVDVLVSIGDKISEGTLLAKAEVSQRDEVPAPSAAAEHAAAAQRNKLPADTVDVVVIGGGPGGYSAAFRAADLGLKTVLVERYETLGGVCLNAGCIPSKALLHLAAVKEEAETLSRHGIDFGNATIDITKVRDYKSSVVKKLTEGLAGMARARKVEVVTGTATFSGPNTLRIAGNEKTAEIAFRNCIVAAGSSAVRLPMLPDDPRVVTSTGALRLESVPKRMLVIGGGIIGLEMATVYSALGSRVDVVERLDSLLAGVDRDLVAIWLKQNGHRFDRIMTATTVKAASAKKDGIEVSISGKVNETVAYDLVLQAPGRTPNGDQLGLEAAGLPTEKGFITVNREMRTAVGHIFAIGDIVGQPMLAHKAVHQGHVAAEVAAGHKAGFDTDLVPSVCYTSPEIAWVGMTEERATRDALKVKVAKFPWAASGRAIANGADYGMTKLIFSEETGRIIGGAIIGPGAGDMIGEVCLAIEMGADAMDIGRTIHPHPTLGETIGVAADVALGVCTDLPPARRERG
ncbi:dihydrolipoyl dehydrogenase [Neorhizobium sp. T7_12]|uniref:dihydrolipoyl dehydrogenase n=1 Tax=Neorhizobium sp. T7_12 TaxID=2093832 RepID=UPI000CF9F063|nr:dihydrolipoyl dehydrogenase [Neorhizobium sp. T7_12]